MSYHPYVDTKHPAMDVVIVRENEEDLYAGIEHQQTDEVMQCLKLISRPGSREDRPLRVRIRAPQQPQEGHLLHQRQHHEDDRRPLPQGLRRDRAPSIPDIEKEHWIVDIGAAKLADTPEAFDVIVMPNLYGDILSDVAAQIAGSVGLAGSANIGEQCAMFEAIHGSAPRRAGQNLANPSGLLLGAVMMLVHIDQPDVAERVHNAWLRTIEDGIHTYDIYKEGVSKQKVGTKEFAAGGRRRASARSRRSSSRSATRHAPKQAVGRRRTSRRATAKKDYVGVDVFLDWTGGAAGQLGPQLEAARRRSQAAVDLATAA